MSLLKKKFCYTYTKTCDILEHLDKQLFFMSNRYTIYKYMTKFRSLLKFFLFYRHNCLHEVVPFYTAKVASNMNQLINNGSQ
jgi:hypothetical protein